MNKTKALLYLFILAIFLATGFLIYLYFFNEEEQQLYSTRKPSHRLIRYEIKTTGFLEAEDLMKIGSIVPGVIEKMYVEENDQVKKNQLLALIDDGKEDTEVRETEAALKKAQEELTYYEHHYERQKALYESRFISDDEFEKIEKDYKQIQNEVQLRQALHDKARIIFENKKIKAPEAGIIVGKTSTEGETVTLASPPTIIYTIARDLKKMNAKMEIDETNVGMVKNSMKIRLTYDTYPTKFFEGTISDISNNPLEKGGSISYLATVKINNQHLMFKPGMTVHGEILVAEKNEVLAVRAQDFKINPLVMERIAELEGFDFKPLDQKDKLAYEEKGDYEVLWVKDGKSFIEVPVKVGINDGAYYEIIEGLKGNEEIIDDTIEENLMEKLFKKFFRAGL